MSENLEFEKTTQPEDNGTQNERLFTQEEVNKIVSDRLERDRAKRTSAAANDELQKAAELKAWESRLTCKEYLIENGYAPELLDCVDTSDVESFKNKIEKIQSIPRTKAHTPQPYCPERGDRSGGVIAEPFKSKKAHTPYKGY